MPNDSIELYGRVHRLTPKAVLFHIHIQQPKDVPERARGLKLWFPRRAVVLFRAHHGDDAISVSKKFLEEKIAEAGPIRPVTQGWVA